MVSREQPFCYHPPPFLVYLFAGHFNILFPIIVMKLMPNSLLPVLHKLPDIFPKCLGKARGLVSMGKECLRQEGMEWGREGCCMKCYYDCLSYVVQKDTSHRNTGTHILQLHEFLLLRTK